MKWYVVDKDFVNYLNSIDNKVEKIDYGLNKLKPYFGIVLNINEKTYYLPVSSAKAKHINMKNSKDFLKICDKKTGNLIAVLNINNMIPIPLCYVKKLDYQQIEQYRTFESELEKSRYIDLLHKELEIINSMSEKIKGNAIDLYNHCKKFPNDRLSIRCCNFMLLEENCEMYVNNEKVID